MKFLLIIVMNVGEIAKGGNKPLKGQDKGRNLKEVFPGPFPCLKCTLSPLGTWGLASHHLLGAQTGPPGGVCSTHHHLWAEHTQHARPRAASMADLIGPCRGVKCMCQGVRACSSLWLPRNGAGKVTLEAISAENCTNSCGCWESVVPSQIKKTPTEW